MQTVTLSIRADDYPARLRALPNPPPSVTVSRRLEAETVVAIVGTRRPHPDCDAFARALATTLARAGIVVASGGAAGIDTAAHEAVLAAGGKTWLVSPAGSARVYPPENGELFRRVCDSEGAVVWPFDAESRPLTFRFWLRNGVMVALADALVVVQAGIPSGTLNAAKWARKLGKPVWVVPTPPWIEGCEGSWSLLESGATPLRSIAGLLKTLGRASTADDLGGLTPSSAPPASRQLPLLSADESLVLRATSEHPKHIDALSVESGLPISRLSTALLTLALENVVVEGPSGFYCRCN